LKKRVEKQQGYNEDEYDIIMQTDDIVKISEYELFLQDMFGYRIDETPYNKLKFNKKENDMNINITEQTTTFPCPVNKLKGQLMDNIGMAWETDHGSCVLTLMSIEWIMQNVLTSKYNTQRCYIYNKAFARWFDNNNAYPSNGTDQYGGKTLAGNCDLCFLKGMKTTNLLLKEKPDLANWWIEQEEKIARSARDVLGREVSTATFRKDRPPYIELVDMSKQPEPMEDMFADDSSMSCFCHD